MPSIRTAVTLGLLAAAAALLAPAPAAQIDAPSYVPIGFFNVWEMVDPTTIDNPDFKKPVTQLISVTKGAIRDDGVVEYNVRTKIFDSVSDVIFTYGIDGDELLLYGARVTAGDFDDIVSVPKLVFEPPVSCGDGATLLGDPIVTPVDTSVKVEIDLGFDELSATVDVTGTVTATWSAVPGGIDTPAGTFDEADIARLSLAFDFAYSSEDEDVNEELMDVTTNKTVQSIMGAGAGFLEIDGAGGTTMELNRAIVAGATWGDFPESLDDVHHLEIPTPGLFSLDHAVNGVGDADATDGVVSLTDAVLSQDVGGALTMTAMVDVVPFRDGSGTPVPVVLKGKTKFLPDGSGARVTLKGKTSHPSLLGKLNLSVKQDVTPDTTELLVAYKAGKDPEGNPVAGELLLPIAPIEAETIVLDVNKLVFASLKANPSKRKLGAEGTLQVGDTITPVKLLATVTVKDGLPNKHTYALSPLEGSQKLLKFGATSTSGADYELTKLVGKLLGYRVKPEDLGTIVAEAGDP